MPDSRFENTEITVKFRPSGTYQAPQTGKLIFTLTKESSTDATEAVLPSGQKEQTITIPAGRYLGTIDEEIEAAKITAPKVPDKEEFYAIKYKIEFPGWPGGARVEEGLSDWEIWPAEYIVETVRTRDAAAEPGKSEGEKFENVTIGESRSNSEGKYKFIPTTPGPVAAFLIKAPYLLVEWVVDGPAGFTTKCRKRKAKVDCKPWIAKILSHPDPALGRTVDTAIPQWVNLDPLDGADKGSLVKVEVGPVDINDIVGRSRKVHIKVTFPTDISKRNDPFPAVWKTTSITDALTPVNAAGKPGVDELVYDMTGANALEIAANSDRVEFYVQLGFAGGVYCKIEVGSVATALTDDKLFLESWRRLQFETWQPKTDGNAATKLSSWTMGGVAGTPGISAAATGHIYQTFAGTATGTRVERDKACYIDWQQSQAGFYTKETLEAQAWIPVSGGASGTTATLIPSWDGAFFEEAAGNKITILTWMQMVKLLRTLNPAPASIVNQVIFADYIAEAEPWSQVFTLSSPGEITPDKNMLPWKIDSGSVAADSITEFKWRPQIKGPTGTWAFSGSWRTLNTKSDIDAHVKILKARSIQFSMPVDPGRLDYPGTFKSQQASIPPPEVRFKVNLTGTAWSWEGLNGCAAQGYIAMNRYPPSMGAVDPIGLTNVVIHEIGHNMGQAYADKSIDSTFGRSLVNMIPGIPNPLSVASGGDLYGGHGHTGTHCAHGLSSSDKACADYGNIGGNDCVMYGADDMTRSAKAMWCVNCKAYIRGTHLNNVRKSWST